MIKQGDQYAQSMSDKLWECYVRELDEVGQCWNLYCTMERKPAEPYLIEMPARILSFYEKRTAHKTIERARHKNSESASGRGVWHLA